MSARMEAKQKEAERVRRGEDTRNKRPDSGESKAT